MTPPPNPGEETPKPDDDPLGGMDPMAWLESLARRQGANPDELVTGGNLELPPAPEAAPESATEADTEPVPARGEMAAPQAAPSAQPPQAVPESAADLTNFTGGMDPMAWLEALARRQGAPTDELVTGGTAEIPDISEIPVTPPVSEELEPLDLGDEFDLEPLPDEILDGTSPLAWLSGMAATEAGGAPQPVGAESGSKEDPLDGMDPMAWLEALARGEGVSEEEALPGATLEPVDESEMAGPEAVGAMLEGAFEAEPSVEIVDGSDPMAWLAGADLSLDEGPSAEPMPEQAAPPPQAVPEPAADLTDFTGGMDPMAWLEALARRQGAPTDELVTGGTAEIPPEPVEAAKTAPAQPEPVAEAAQPEFTWEPQAEPEPQFAAWEPQAEIELPPAEPLQPEASQAVAEPAADLTDFTGGMDPMAWLEALARRQGAPTDELVTGGTAEIPPEPVEAAEAAPVQPEPVAEVAQPEFTWEPSAEPEPQFAAWEPQAEIELPPAEPLQPEASQAVAEPAAELTDFTGGMDPMAWLEALARRQGAPTDELVTGGTAEIPPEPIEAAEAAPVQPEPVAAVAQPEFTWEPQAEPAEVLDATDPLAWLSSVTDEAGLSLDALGLTGGAVMPEPGEPQAEPGPAADLSTFTGGEDPLRWLESLAARQGASRDELVTAADLDIPVPAPDATVDGPGYSEFDPFSVTAPGRAPGEIPEGVATPEAMTDADALAWLESLTGASQIDLSMLDTPAPALDVTDQTMTAESALSWLESLARETPPATVTPAAMPSTPEPAVAGQPGDRMAGGLSDDVGEVRAWLEAQARELEQTREQLEEQEPYVAAEMPTFADEPAVPGEVPDWLTKLRDTDTMEAVPSEALLAESPLVEDVALPDVPADLPTWLTEAQPGVDLESLELDEALPQAEVSPEPAAISLPSFSPDELEALTRPASPDDVDSWAEALDEEYNRRVAGDETIPDWYLEAIRRAEGEGTGDAVSVSAVGEIPASEAKPEPIIERDAIPDWLRASIPEAPTAVTEDLSDVPPWLVEMSAGIDLPPVQAGPLAPEEVRPPWLPPPDEAPAAPVQAEPPVVEPVRAAPAMAAPPAPPPPQPAAPRPIRRELSPSRYHEVLRDARQMAAAPEQVHTALELYQALVDDSQLLEEAREDLKTLAQQHPAQPKVHRLLGDTYMRMGDLQSALDTYLSALDQL